MEKPGKIVNKINSTNDVRRYVQGMGHVVEDLNSNQRLASITTLLAVCIADPDTTDAAIDHMSMMLMAALAVRGKTDKGFEDLMKMGADDVEGN